MLIGSFIMAVIHFARVILEHIRRLKSENRLLNCLAYVAICLIECCRAFWDMLSTNAYYLVAMFGIPFCTALTLGMELMSLGITSLFYVIGNMMVNVGIILVVVGSTLSTLWATEYEIVDETQLEILCILVGVGLIISSVILTVYSVRKIHLFIFKREAFLRFFFFQTITRALYVCVCVDIRQSPNQPFTKVPGLVKYIEKTHTSIARNQNMV